jgi:hypothetical protein
MFTCPPKVMAQHNIIFYENSLRFTETVLLEMFTCPPKVMAQHNIIFYENSKCQWFPTLCTPTYVTSCSIPEDALNTHMSTYVHTYVLVQPPPPIRTRWLTSDTDMYLPLQIIPEDTYSQITLKRGIWEVRNYERNFFLTGTDHLKVSYYLYNHDRKKYLDVQNTTKFGGISCEVHLRVFPYSDFTERLVSWFLGTL